MYYVKRQIFQPGLGIFGLCTVSCLLTVYKGRVNWSSLNCVSNCFGRRAELSRQELATIRKNMKQENAAQYIYRSLLNDTKIFLQLLLLHTVYSYPFATPPHLEQCRLMMIQLTCRHPLGKISVNVLQKI